MYFNKSFCIKKTSKIISIDINLKSLYFYTKKEKSTRFMTDVSNTLCLM